MTFKQNTQNYTSVRAKVKAFVVFLLTKREKPGKAVTATVNKDKLKGNWRECRRQEMIQREDDDKSYFLKRCGFGQQLHRKWLDFSACCRKVVVDLLVNFLLTVQIVTCKIKDQSLKNVLSQPQVCAPYCKNAVFCFHSAFLWPFLPFQYYLKHSTGWEKKELIVSILLTHISTFEVKSYTFKHL